MLSISEFEFCENENGSYAENIQRCLLLKTMKLYHKLLMKLLLSREVRWFKKD